MKKWFIILIISSEILFGQAVAAEVEVSSVYVYYMPFDIDTYAPVTTDSISNQSFCQLKLTESSDSARSLAHILNIREAGKFSHKTVRLRVHRPGHFEIFVDTDGGVLLGEGQEAKLSTENFTLLRTILEALCAECETAD